MKRTRRITFDDVVDAYNQMLDPTCKNCGDEWDDPEIDRNDGCDCACHTSPERKPCDE